MDFVLFEYLATLLGPSAVVVGVLFYVYNRIINSILVNRTHGKLVETKVDNVAKDVKCLSKDMIELKVEQARLSARDEVYSELATREVA